MTLVWYVCRGGKWNLNVEPSMNAYTSTDLVNCWLCNIYSRKPINLLSEYSTVQVLINECQLFNYQWESGSRRIIMNNELWGLKESSISISMYSTGEFHWASEENSSNVGTDTQHANTTILSKIIRFNYFLSKFLILQYLLYKTLILVRPRTGIYGIASICSNLLTRRKHSNTYKATIICT